MPVGKGASATLKALQSDQDFVNEAKETEQKDTTQTTLPESIPEIVTELEPAPEAKPLSKRQLMERGEYMLVNFQLPVALYNELKKHQLELELKGEKFDRADIVKLALESYLEQQR